MHDARTDARDDDSRGTLPQRYRLAWRFNGTGTSGHGPWMHRADVVEAWVESLNRRHRTAIVHWLETG